MCFEKDIKTMTNEPKIRNAILVNEFTEFGVKSFKSDFDELNSGLMPIIPIFIDSFGGEIYSLLAMLDIISTATKPVATIALGKAMSCGSILLACGTPKFRFVGPHSTVMIHDAATFSFGKIEDLKAEIESLKTELAKQTEVKDVVELSEQPLTHNPDAKQNVEKILFSQGREMTTFDRVMSKIAN